MQKKVSRTVPRLSLMHRQHPSDLVRLDSHLGTVALPIKVVSGDPTHPGMPLTQDLQPGAHDAFAGLASELAHTCRSCSFGGSSRRCHRQPCSKSSL